MADPFSEIDELVRRERLMTFWRTHGNTLIGAVLTLIVAIALYQGYQALQASKAEKTAAALTSALETKTDKVAALSGLASTKGNAGVLARLLAADAAIEKKDFEAAKTLLMAARNDAGATIELRERATLLWVRLSADDAKADPAHLLGALDPLMRSDSQPWAWQARLEAAAILANRKNDPAAALKMIEPMLNNPGLPFTQSERANAMAHVYRAKAGEKK